ncbi:MULTISPECIES: hypothetical protein [Marinomonas]|uniref:DNA polymerase III beta sliding clamp central domain-containing protein n=1 Tax=Marinomonas rhodophyticola TaxID=2992803 RepID=A0ABT3KGE8_9GAMM|nr:hypothetical protein [Marinomonas sp. KJ51-3]MCW4629616.1 hypothetical protein [Marinomonas sp. KJ51-3]
MLIPIKPENYKDITIEQPEFERLSIPAKIIRAAQLFRAKKDVRFYLKGILLDPQGYISATNGHIAIRIECEECKRLSKQMIIDIKGRKIPKKATKLDLVSMSSKHGVILMNGASDEVRSFSVIDHKFPDMNKVMRTLPPSPAKEIQVDPSYMKEIAKARSILGFKKGPIIMKFNDGDPIEINIPSSEFAAKIVLMPMKY